MGRTSEQRAAVIGAPKDHKFQLSTQAKCQNHKVKMYPMQSDDAPNHDLDCLKRKVNILDLGQTTMKQFARIQKMAADGDLSLKEVATLTAAIPDVLGLQRATLAGLSYTIAQAQAGQRDALNGALAPIKGVLKTLDTLAAAAETDQTRTEIARMVVEVGRLGVEVSLIIERMNRDNNGFWTSATGAAAAVAVALLFVFSGGRVRIPLS